MKLLLIFFTLSCIKDTSAQIKHADIQISGCTESNKEYVMEHDEEEIFHSDFKKQGLVMKLPDFADPIDWPGGYEYSISEQEICKHNLGLAVTSYKKPPEALEVEDTSTIIDDDSVASDAPQNSIYPRDNVRLGSQSTLICHSARFFPPPVNIRWTRNGVDVTESSTLSQFYPNEDNTYNQFSHLRFTPQQGDVYTCTVEHKALQTPDTKTWEVDVELPSVGPAVFCGVGLAVGLLGVATGTFFLVKGNQCN